MSKKLTISDIAALAGVSKTTVSFILNGKEGVGEDTRQKVLRIIEKHDYKPMLNSRRLVFQKSYTVAVVFDKMAPEFDNLFYFGIMSSLMRQCAKYEYSLIYSQYICTDTEVQLPDNILQKDVDGLIFLKEIGQPLMARLLALEIPFVIIDDHTSYDGPYSIKADYTVAAHTAVQYLLQQGHRDIGFVGNSRLPAFYVQVMAGYQSALCDRHVSINPAWVFDDVADEDTARERLGAGNICLPTALFCMEDMLAIHVMRALQQRGIRIPQDVSVIAIDNILLSQYVTPGLTTVAIDMEQMGMRAVDMLMKRIQGKPVQTENIASSTIVVRNTVQALPHTIS